MNDPVAFVAGLKLLGAGLAMLGAIGAGVGVGLAASVVCRRWVATLMRLPSFKPI